MPPPPPKKNKKNTLLTARVHLSANNSEKLVSKPAVKCHEDITADLCEFSSPLRLLITAVSLHEQFICTYRQQIAYKLHFKICKSMW